MSVQWRWRLANATTVGFVAMAAAYHNNWAVGLLALVIGYIQVESENAARLDERAAMHRRIASEIRRGLEDRRG